MTPFRGDDTTRRTPALEDRTRGRDPLDPEPTRDQDAPREQPFFRRAGRRPEGPTPPASAAPEPESGRHRPKPAPMAPRRRRSRWPSRSHAVGLGVFLMASVALAVVLLFSARTPTSSPPLATLPATPPASLVTRPGGAPPPTAGPTARPTEPSLRVSISVLEPNYTVEPNDNLGTIARRSGTTVEALQAYNRLEPGAILRVGQRLIVPTE
ncbi:MAG: LysM peptidoglycan-binding domain-containing protein [Chloroflexi bacterium]|nr:LysM peptidoglycan-binding domain-containing protein [Chloroflexota bacterium]